MTQIFGIPICGWCKSLAVAKIAKDGTITYLDERAKTDAYVQDVIRERLAKLG